MAHHRIKPNKDNFIQIWLKKQAPSSAYKAFQHLPLAEINGARDIVFRPLAETVFLNHDDPEDFRKNVIALGYPNLAEAAKEVDRRPKKPNIRKGNFGEILASEFLRQCEGYDIPVYRLRESSDDSPAPGEDILAFKFGSADGKGRELLIGESKVRGQYASTVVEEAYDQLCKSRHRSRPKSLMLIVRILRKQDQDEKANQILSFLHKLAPNQPTRRSLLFLITGNIPRDSFRHIQDQKEIIENLIAVNLQLSNLDDFVNALFSYEVKINGA